MKLEVLSILLLSIIQIQAWRIFHRGRIVGGNVGEPRTKQERQTSEGEEWYERATEEYFSQKLDHFDPTNTKTWLQRYFGNDQFYNSADGGPVFLMIGGEGDATVKWMVKGAWIDYAQAYGAYLFELEHRFYGKSQPTEDVSTENLKYLSSEQATADLAYFIMVMNAKYKFPPSTKWIVFGGSYPGSLAAWVRLKYPHLVYGAVSSSGPVLAFADFQEYFKIVVSSLETGGPGCVSNIAQAMNQVNILLTEEIGQENLNVMFKLCDRIQDSIQSQKDINNLFETIADNFAGIVQYNKCNRLGKNAAKNITIDVVCEIMNNQNLGPPVNRLAAINDLILSAYEQQCLDYKYDKMIDVLRNTSWESTSAEGGRQWTYQTCTEFGFYQTSTAETNIFTNKFEIDFFIHQCIDIFGEQFNETLLNTAIERTNMMFGGFNVDVSRVIFVHGSLDPWHALGVLHSKNPGSTVVYIQGTSHCANMYPKTDEDYPQLIAAREEICDIIGKWVG